MFPSCKLLQGPLNIILINCVLFPLSFSFILSIICYTWSLSVPLACTMIFSCCPFGIRSSGVSDRWEGREEEGWGFLLFFFFFFFFFWILADNTKRLDGVNLLTQSICCTDHLTALIQICYNLITEFDHIRIWIPVRKQHLW